MMALKAGGIAVKDHAALEKAMAGVTFAVFQSAWSAPTVDKGEEVQVTATLGGKQVGTTLEPLHIRIRPTADWLREPPVSVGEVGRYLNRFHDNLPPGRLLFLLKSVAENGGLNSPPILSFFAIAFREREEARSAAIALYPSLDPKMKLAVAISFRFAGLDISGFLPGLPANLAASLKGVEPFRDPRRSMSYRDPISVDTVRGIGSTMDECWGGWMATGDRSYLRALVDLLAGAPDFPAFQAWVKARGGEKGLNAGVARGLAYQTAGWSIGAFQRADPHVADWLLYWQGDPGFPPMLRSQLESLPANPDFRRN